MHGSEQCISSHVTAAILKALSALPHADKGTCHAERAVRGHGSPQVLPLSPHTACRLPCKPPSFDGRQLDSQLHEAQRLKHMQLDTFHFTLMCP